MPFIDNYKATVSDQSFDSLCGFLYEKMILTSLHANQRMDELLYIPNTKLFLFTGPEGYGKHSLTNALSNYLYDYEYEYFYIDCEELVDEGKEEIAIQGIFSDIFQYTSESEDEEGNVVKGRRFYVVFDNFELLCQNKKVVKMLKRSFDCLESAYSEYDCECTIAAITNDAGDIPAKLRQHMNVFGLSLPSENDRTEFFTKEFTFYFKNQEDSEDGFLPYDSETGARAMAEFTEGLSYAELRKVILLGKLYYRQQVCKSSLGSDFALYAESAQKERIGFLKEDDVKDIVKNVLSGRALPKAEAQPVSVAPQIIYAGPQNIQPYAPVMGTSYQQISAKDDPDVVDVGMYEQLKQEQEKMDQDIEDDLDPKYI